MSGSTRTINVLVHNSTKLHHSGACQYSHDLHLPNRPQTQTPLSHLANSQHTTPRAPEHSFQSLIGFNSTSAIPICTHPSGPKTQNSKAGRHRVYAESTWRTNLICMRIQLAPVHQMMLIPCYMRGAQKFYYNSRSRLPPAAVNPSRG